MKPARMVGGVHREFSGRKSLCTTRNLNRQFSRASFIQNLPKVVSGKHNIFSHSPKNHVCRRAKFRSVPWRQRSGSHILPAENFGELTTAGHKVLNLECESRNSNKYAVIVQNLATPPFCLGHWGSLAA